MPGTRRVLTLIVFAMFTAHAAPLASGVWLFSAGGKNTSVTDVKIGSPNSIIGSSSNPVGAPGAGVGSRGREYHVYAPRLNEDGRVIIVKRVGGAFVVENYSDLQVLVKTVNSTYAVQRALSFSHYDGRGTVVLEDDVFKISGSLQVRGGTTLYFNRSTLDITTLRFNSGSFIINGSDIAVEGSLNVSEPVKSGVYFLDVVKSSGIVVDASINASGFPPKPPEGWASYLVNIYRSSNVTVAGQIRIYSGDAVQVNSGSNISISNVWAEYHSDTESSIVNIFDQASSLRGVSVTGVVVHAGGKLNVTPIMVYGYSNESLSGVHLSHIYVYDTSGDADGVDLIGGFNATVESSVFRSTNVGVSVISSDTVVYNVSGYYDRAPSVEVGDPAVNLSVTDVVVNGSLAYDCGIGNGLGSPAASGFAVYAHPGSVIRHVLLIGDRSVATWPNGQRYAVSVFGDSQVTIKESLLTGLYEAVYVHLSRVLLLKDLIQTPLNRRLAEVK